jgi:hypothetical protein
MTMSKPGSSILPVTEHSLLPYGSIGREFFMGNRLKNAGKLHILLEDALDIMAEMSEPGWLMEGQIMVRVPGVRNAAAWAGYFNANEFAAHMSSSTEALPDLPAYDGKGKGKGKNQETNVRGKDILVIEIFKAEDLYKCVNFLSQKMRTLSRSVAGVAPNAETREGYTWFPVALLPLVRAYGIPFSVRDDFIYANVANKEREFRGNRDLFERGRKLHDGLMTIMRVSHLPSYYSSEQLPLYENAYA